MTRTEDRTQEVLQAVVDELARAVAKFGPFASTHEGYAVILEELDELWYEIKSNDGRDERAFAEAVQVAAMAIRYAIDLKVPDVVGGVEPLVVPFDFDSVPLAGRTTEVRHRTLVVADGSVGMRRGE